MNKNPLLGKSLLSPRSAEIAGKIFAGWLDEEDRNRGGFGALEFSRWRIERKLDIIPLNDKKFKSELLKNGWEFTVTRFSTVVFKKVVKTGAKQNTKHEKSAN